MFALSFATLIVSVSALVPQVPLCSYEGCPSVSRVGLGCLHLGDKISGLTDPAEINAWIQNGLDQGINLIDTADVYPVLGGKQGESAKLLGQALALTPGMREQLTIVAKMDIIFPNSVDTSREHLTSTLEWYLESLGTEYIDILLLHYADSFMNPTEVAATFNDFKEQGKVKHFGTSNHYPSRRKVLLTALKPYNIDLVTNEIEISVWNPSYFNYNTNLVDDAMISGYRNLAWSPLGGNPVGGLNRLFTRKGKRQEKILHSLRKVGKEIDESEDTVVAIAWLLSHAAGVVPLIGSTNIDHVNTILKAFEVQDKITSTLWWDIANAGGVCPLGDSMCDYDLYSASMPSFLNLTISE